MRIERYILELLIAKYEKSMAYKEQRVTNRRILIKENELGKIDFEDYEMKSDLFDSLNELKEKSMIDYSWMKYEENNLIKEIWLNLDAVDEVYTLLGIRSKLDENRILIDLLQNEVFRKGSWMEAFKKDILERYNETRTITHMLMRDIEKSKKFIELMAFLNRTEDENYHERILSSELYSDSKYFQRELKKKLIQLVKKYEDLEEDDEALAILGIRNNPDTIEWKGNLQLLIDDYWMPFDKLIYGNIINVENIDVIQAFKMENIQRIIFIENRATFDSYSKIHGKAELVIYLGGFSGKKKLAFIERIFREYPDKAYFEWSDIDLGGFRIFEQLKSVIPSLVPMLMSKDVLNDHLGKCVFFNKEYEKKLRKRVDNCFAETIEKMLEHNIRLEQEHISMDYAKRHLSNQ
jgi:hypothetical protein